MHNWCPRHQIRPIRIKTCWYIFIMVPRLYVQNDFILLWSHFPQCSVEHCTKVLGLFLWKSFITVQKIKPHNLIFALDNPTYVPIIVTKFGRHICYGSPARPPLDIIFCDGRYLNFIYNPYWGHYLTWHGLKTTY